MKISKIFLFTAAALALCGACDDSDDKVDPSTTEDKISVSPMEGVVGSKGGDVSAMVTSSGAWTLEGESDFVTPSATSGEDGAEIVFEVDPNETEEERSANYVFKMGSKEVEFQIVEKGETGETIEITSKSEMRLAYTAVERLAVELTTNVNYRNLTAEIVSETEGWLTYTIAPYGCSRG